MKNTNFKTLKILSLCLVVWLVLATITACGSTSESMTAGSDMGYVNKGDGMSEVFPEIGNGTTDKPTADSNMVEYERKIIRTVTLACETKAFDDSLHYILDTLAAYKGYAQASSVRGTGYNGGEKASARVATYTLRVPAASLDAFLSDLSKQEGIRITRQTSTSDEITSSYYDLATRISTLETERDVLSQMLAGFTDYSDINAMLSVQERLYNVIEEIESLKTRLNLYDDQVDLSTIELTLNEVFTYTEVATPTFGERMGEAFVQSWQNFADGCQDFAVWVVASLPALLIFGTVAIVAVILLVKTIRKVRSRRHTEGDK